MNSKMTDEDEEDVSYMKAEEYDKYLDVCRENTELKEKIKLLENTCDTWQEIQKTDNELLHEFEKENEHLKAIWGSYIKKEEDWDKERHAWMQERFGFRNKIAELEMNNERLISKLESVNNCNFCSCKNCSVESCPNYTVA